MPNGLFAFQDGTGRARVIEDCIANLTEGGADLLWIETDTPNVDEIAAMVAEIRKRRPERQAGLQQLAVVQLDPEPAPPGERRVDRRGQDPARTAYPEGTALMSAEFDASDLGREADDRLARFQVDISARAGVFHNLITLPTFHLTAKSMDELSRAISATTG